MVRTIYRGMLFSQNDLDLIKEGAIFEGRSFSQFVRHHALQRAKFIKEVGNGKINS